MRPLWVGSLVLLSLPVPVRADVAFQFDPKEPLVDEVVNIRLTALPAGSVVTIRARADWFDKAWQGFATFRADDKGTVNLGEQAPLKGTYSGVDAMGLFWAMEPDPDRPKPARCKLTDPRVTTFEAERDGKLVAKAELRRWLVRPGVCVSEVKEDGMVGTLFEPEGKGRRPGLLVLSGAEGGVNENEAALLASHGYVTFALAYFGTDGLPKQLTAIPLESLKKGVDWLAARDSVHSKRLGVVGASKGGELALLLASHFPELRVVVARAPSHVVWFDLGSFKRSSWSRAGKELPFVPQPEGTATVFFKRPIRIVDIYQPALEDKDHVAKARIAVENIQGGVLMISGTDDQLWPSAYMADQVVARLKACKHPFPVQHLKYEGAGHAIPPAFVPGQPFLSNGPITLGGTAAANAKAFADFGPKVLRFLEVNLKKP
jgi:dipeptidyl aminopeptidase/acylaminoacyl peptidase